MNKLSAVMTLDKLLETINRKLLDISQRPINTAETLILRGIWQHKTYQEIAQQEDYSPGYLTNVAAPELFRRLSELVGQRVNKKNCQALLEFYVATPTLPVQRESPPLLSEAIPLYPSGAVPLHSPFYIQRSPCEEQIYREIHQPGTLIRIRSPQEMGKTSLLLRVLDYAKTQNYHTVSLNFEQVEREIISDLDRLLRWLCINVSRQLKLPSQLQEYWDKDIGSKVSCTLYFRGYLLENINAPLILALDEVNRIFEHPHVTKDFFPLLRSWYEEAKRSPFWQKLRIIVVHSTNIYVPLQLEQSPFNVGFPIELNPFNEKHIQQLALCYGITWNSDQEARKLMILVGGHPALVQIALYYLSRNTISFSELLETAATETGIYLGHLRRHWSNLQAQPELMNAIMTIVHSTEPVSLDPIIAHKLRSMGLIYLKDNKAIISCLLYQQYFKNSQMRD